MRVLAGMTTPSVTGAREARTPDRKSRNHDERRGDFVIGTDMKTFVGSKGVMDEGLVARLDWNSLLSRDPIDTLGIAHSNLASKGEPAIERTQR